MNEVKVPLPANFNFPMTVQSHGWLQLAPFDYDQDALILYRVQQLTGGSVVRLAFHPPLKGEMTIAVDGTIENQLHVSEIAAIARRIFSLDLDLEKFYELLRGREEYAWVEPRGAGRLLCCPTVWEELVKTLMTTNTTWGATRNMVKRIVALGPSASSGTAFPTPQQVAEFDPGELGELVRAGYRTAYLSNLAQGIASGDLDVESWRDGSLQTDELYRQIMGLKGFGPYAAAIVMKLLGRFDRLAIDTSARSAFAHLHNDGQPPADRQIKAHYQPYGQWQGLVMWMDLIRYYGDN